MAEHKRREDELRLFKAIIDSSNEAIAISDPSGKLVYVNPAHERLFGRSLEEAQELNYREYYPPECVRVLDESVVPALARGESWEGVLDVLDADGRRFSLWQRAYTVRDADGKMLYAFGLMHDISEDVKQERALRESETRYRALFETSPMGIGLATLDGQILDTNPAMCRMIGYSHEEIKHINVKETYKNPRDREVLLSRLRRDGYVAGFEVELKRKCGASYWANLSIVPIELDGEDVLLAVAEDVTARKHAQEALRQSEERYRMLVETMKEGLVVMDGNLRITYANDGLCQMLGYTQNELVGMFVMDFEPCEEKRELIKARAAELRKGEAQPYETEFRRKDGQRISVIISPRAIFDDQGRFKGSFGVITDVTELRRAREELQRASQYKDEFLANMSHDLRTPLTSLLGAVELLRRGRAKGEEAQMWQIIAQNGNHLLRLIDDLLDLSKAQDGRLVITPSRLSVLDVVAEACNSIGALARRAGIDVTVESGTDVNVWADRTRVIQILNNLLTNGVKFTPKGGRVTVGWRAKEDVCEIWVEDTGIGIPGEQKSKVFSRFERTAAPVIHEGMPQGLGLGLAAARTLVELQGGRMWFDSTEGEGTTFRFVLPLASPPQRHQQPEEDEGKTVGPDAPTLAGARVLVIEDDRDIARMLRMFLETEDAAVTLARTATEGLQAAREGHPDVILLDITLPDMDGFSAASRLTADSATSEIPIIALTGQAAADIRDRCLAAGCTKYVSKPVDLDRLIETISAAIKRK